MDLVPEPCRICIRMRAGLRSRSITSLARPFFHFFSDRHNRRSPLTGASSMLYAALHELHGDVRQNPINLTVQ